MTFMNPKFEHDLKGLLSVGLFYCYSFFGVIVLLFLFNSQYYSSLYYLPLKIIGTLLGYSLIMYVVPGGGIHLSPTYKSLSKEEKKLDALIRKDKNNYVVTFAILLFLLSTIYYDIQISLVAQISFFDSVVVFLFFTIVTGMLGQGVKYLTAWWNIKRHWQKEFQS
jgi:hypothetical protein